MTSLPYMQLYVSDYLADTAHLSASQHGAYMLLLMNYWQRGKPLDNSNDRLAFVARLSPEEWLETKSVLAEFFQIDGDTWSHSRIERDLQGVRERSAKASYAGKRSSVQRSFNDRSTNVQRSINQEEEEEDKEEDIKETIRTFPSESDFNLFWNSYPRKTAKGAAKMAWLKALKKEKAQVIIEAACRFAEDKNRDPSFTPHASTWLNQERWADESLPPKPPQNGSRRLDETPTVVPPKYVEEDRSNAVPMPEDVRSLLAKITRNP